MPPITIHPMRSLGLLSVAHAINHAQAVVLPLIFLKIVDEFGVGIDTIAFLAAIGAFLRAAREMRARGTFAFAVEAVSYSEINSLFDD